MSYQATARPPQAQKVQPDEIAPGLVAFLDLGAIVNHPLCRVWNNGGGDPHPCVCVHVTKRVGLWSPLTTTRRPERLLIRTEWKIGGTRSFRLGDVYLCDGANIFAVPHELVPDFNDGERSNSTSRGRLTPQGLEAVLTEISRNTNRRIAQ